MIKPLLLACFIVAGSALAQATVEKIPYLFTTGSVSTGQLGDPGFWRLPNGGQLVTLDTLTGGAFPSFVAIDGGTPNPYFSGIYVSADGRGDVLALSVKGGGIDVARPDDAGVLTDGGVGVVLQSFIASAFNQIALRTLGDGGFEVWADNGALEINHYTLNRLPGDGGFALTTAGSVSIPQATTGIAVDDVSGRLFVVQPTLGLVLVEPDLSASFIVSIDAGTMGTTANGVDLFTAFDGRIFVFTTARNDGQVFITEVDGFAVNDFGRFRVVEPDGGLGSALSPRAIDIEARAFGSFPNGALFVQDDVGMPSPNIKVVDLAAVGVVFPIPLGPPPTVDGGVGDGGTGTDGGTTDAGTGTSSPSGPGIGGGNSGTPRSLCACGAGPFSLLPLLAAFWWRRRRSV